MAKKKPKSTEPSVAELVAVAKEVNAVAGCLDDEIHDVCDSLAGQMRQEVWEKSLEDQLEFLLEHGYDVKRLEELIRESGLAE